MALNKQLVDFPLAAGVDTRNDEGSTSPIQNTDIINMRFTNPGSLVPATAYTSADIYGATTIYGAWCTPDIKYVHASTAIVAADRSQTLTYQIPGTGTRIKIGGQVGTTIYSTSTEYIAHSTSSNDKILVCWAMSGSTTGVGYQWLSLSGELLYAGSFSTSSAPKKVIATDNYGNNTAVIWTITNSGALECFQIEYGVSGKTNLSVPSLSNLTHLSVIYSAADTSNTAQFWITYYSTTGTSTYVSKYSLSGTSITADISPVTVSTSAVLGIDIARTTNYVAVAYWLDGTSTHKVTRYSSSLTGASTLNLPSGLSVTGIGCGFGMAVKPNTTDIVGIMGAASPTYSNGSSNYNSYVIAEGWEVNFPGASVQTKLQTGLTSNYRIVSRPVYMNDTMGVMAVDLSLPGYMSHALLLGVYTGTTSGAHPIGAIWDYNEAHGYPDSSNALVLTNNVASSNGVYYFAGAILSDYISTTSSTTAGTALPIYSTYYTSVSVMKFDTTADMYVNNIKFGNTNTLISPILFNIDGIGLAPNTLWPNQYLVGGGQAGGTLVDGSTYQYIIERVWKDAAGNESRLDSHAVAFLANATNKTCRLYLYSSQRLGTEYMSASALTKINIYRTEADGSILYYLTSVAGNTTTYDDTGGSLDYTRILPSSAGDLPTTGVALPRSATVWKQRLAAISADYPKSVMYTAPISEGSIPVFKTGLKVDVSQAINPLVAISTMDGILYAFTDSQTFLIYGDPPGVTGEGGTLSAPELRFNSIGATHAYGVLQTSKGLIVHSKRGFYLILRNQEVVYIGDGPFEDREKNILGSYVDQVHQEAVFLFSGRTTDPVTSASVCTLWAYDLIQNTWSRRQYTATDDPVALTTESGDTIIWTDTTQMTEQTTKATVTAYESPWMRLGPIQGYQRLYNILLKVELLTACDITIDLYTDYNETSQYTWSLDSTTLTLTQGTIKLSAPKQKCEAFKLRIYMESQSTGGNLKLQGITAEIGVKDTTYKQYTGPNNT